MWNVSSKKVIDRVWRKTSFHCKGKPFFKNAHSNSQKLVKSLRVNHFDSTTSRFRTQIWKIRLDEEMGICSSKGPNGPIWTTCPHCETRVLTRVITETYGCTIKCFCCIPYYCTGDGKTALHTCPKCNYVIARYTQEWWLNQYVLWRIKYINSNKIKHLWWIK